MKNKGNFKINIYKIIALIGIILGGGTMFSRSVVEESNDIIVCILGILPNFGVVLFILFLLIVILEERKKYELEFIRKVFYLSLPILILLLFLSEVWHHFFLNSSFDINDMIASILAIIINIILFRFLNKGMISERSDLYKE